MSDVAPETSSRLAALVLVVVVCAAAFVGGAVGAARGNGAPDFSCNGATGVYHAENVVVLPNDPACAHTTTTVKGQAIAIS